jgi:hypothetical protein
MFSKVHCTYITLGQSLQQGGHVDNFLIPVFCRKLFEDNHPSKSGKHHFFSIIGVSTLFFTCVLLSMVSSLNCCNSFSLIFVFLFSSCLHYIEGYFNMDTSKSSDKT